MIMYATRHLAAVEPPMTHNYPFGPIVYMRVDRVTCDDVHKVIAACNNTFWFRQTQGPGMYCIPIINGVPVVHRYVIVDASWVRFPGEEVRGAKS